MTSDPIEVSEDLLRARILQELGFMTSALLHEMRQPMFAMKALVQLMQIESSPEQLNQLSDQLGHMEDLLDFYGAHGASGAPGVFDLNREVVRAVDLFRHHARARKVQLDVEVHPGSLYVTGRATAVRQILVNLVRNALESVQDGGGTMVLVRTEPGPVLWVTDDGPGVDQVVKAQLFDAWVTTKGAGTGLGLWISRQLAIELGATLELQDGPSGASFELRWLT